MPQIPDVGAALYAKLSNTAAITAIVGAKIANLRAPKEWATPYLVFELASGIIPNITPRDRLNHVYRVHSWHTGWASALALHRAVYAALHEQELTIAGWSNKWMVCENEQHFRESVEGVDYNHLVWDVQIEASAD